MPGRQYQRCSPSDNRLSISATQFYLLSYINCYQKKIKREVDEKNAFIAFRVYKRPGGRKPGLLVCSRRSIAGF